MNTELARQRAHISAVRARIATGRRPEVTWAIARPSARDLGVFHNDHVRVWRRVERARRARGPRVEDVLDAACEAWNEAREEFLAGSSHRCLPARRRQVVMFLCRELARHVSLLDVGARLRRDHTTVLQAHRTVARLLAASDALTTRMVTEVRAYLGLPS